MLRDAPSDGLPLSSYPMFAPGRGETAHIPVVVGVDRTGEDVRLDPGELAGTDEVMLAAKTVRHAVAAGAAATDRLCREVASRLDPDEVVRVEVRTEIYDVVAWYDGDRAPAGVEVHARCSPR
jgi:hypothetical protein